MKSVQTRCAEQLNRLEIAAEEYQVTLEELASVTDTICEIDGVRHGIRPLSFFAVIRIRDFYPRINPMWLLQGDEATTH